MQGNSRSIISNQTDIHQNLAAIVARHLAHESQKPIADHTRKAFDEVNDQVQQVARPIVLDACCGVGDSARFWADYYPEHWVVGVDKSADRISRERQQTPNENLILTRADLNDFYRLAVEANWQPEKHYILFPNPWPKSAHIQRRWHGSAAFSSILKLGGRLELRSNWSLYLQEFAAALDITNNTAEVSRYEPVEFITPFERKYHQSGQSLFKLTSELKSFD
ncbi:tRNA (guanine(46)-N(7))-methyltransferase TrmB [Algibacillus agarilyticus]|uniref:tRNA (guanine(46)-N(7))-methyltransferase TrmB n=1 Tax=Algibacillus agarilyticus TaxID=2234133 RepID=UPI000DD00993|nr:SAM-dependent methyltransferase [Algibacillus agarilyticus]